MDGTYMALAGLAVLGIAWWYWKNRSGAKGVSFMTPAEVAAMNRATLIEAQARSRQDVASFSGAGFTM